MHAVGALVLAPTRELAAQISAVAAILCEANNLVLHTMVGGSNETASTQVGFYEIYVYTIVHPCMHV
jgi:superfamily II DNA/RNA helicase